MPLTAPFVDHIVVPSDAPDVGVKVDLGAPVPVMLAPEGDTRWGMFMFPSIWRLRDGRLVCAVTLGEDEVYSEADYHYLWYLSDDNGRHWTHVVVNVGEAVSFLRERITLRNGRQIYFEPKIASLDAFADVAPAPADPRIGYLGGLMGGPQLFYRLGDLPDECRYLTMYTRGPSETDWHVERATMDPDILIPAFKEDLTTDSGVPAATHSAVATRLRSWVRHVGDQRLPNIGACCKHYTAEWAVAADVDPAGRSRDSVVRLQIPTPTGVRLHDQSLEPVTELRDGALLVHSKRGRRRLRRPDGDESSGHYPNMFKSTDGGRTWQHHANLHYASAGPYVLARAHVQPDMPNGNWSALIRSLGSESSAYLGPLFTTRSADGGHEWTEPVAIRPVSVNPVGGLLANGIAYRIYGRPGLFLTFCSDGEGRDWGSDRVLVPAVSDLTDAAGVERSTCANPCVLAAGRDRFLVAYTDYAFQDATGRRRKAVLVREIMAEPATRLV